MKKKTFEVKLDLDAGLVAEIEAYGEKRSYPNLEVALVKALEEFFRGSKGRPKNP